MSVVDCWRGILSIVLLILIICVEIAYREPAYNYSLTFIVRWQQRGNESLKPFFKFVSAFGTPNIIAFFFLLIYSFGSRRLVIKTILTIYVAQNFITFFKVFYHSPRPYLSLDEIEAMNCSEGYGNPSGHCLFTTAFYGTMWVILFPKNTEPGQPLFSKKWQRTLVECVSFFLVLALIVLTFFARLYLGSHGLNQTIYGATLGLWIVYTFGVVVPYYVDYHYDHFMKKGNVFTLFNLSFLLVVIVFSLLQILNLILFFVLRNHKKYANEEWLARMEAKCPEFNSTPFEDSFKGGLHSSVYAFMYFGQLVSARLFSDAFNYWYSNIGAKKLTLRTLNTIIVLGLCYLPYFLTRDSSFVLKICLGILLTNVLIVLVGVPFIDWSTEKLELISVERLIKERETTEDGYGTV